MTHKTEAQKAVEHRRHLNGREIVSIFRATYNHPDAFAVADFFGVHKDQLSHIYATHDKAIELAWVIEDLFNKRILSQGYFHSATDYWRLINMAGPLRDIIVEAITPTNELRDELDASGSALDVVGEIFRKAAEIRYAQVVGDGNPPFDEHFNGCAHVDALDYYAFKAAWYFVSGFVFDQEHQTNRN